MKVANPAGREYYLQRSKDNRIANWCSSANSVFIGIDDAVVEVFGNPDRSDWIYLIYEGTAYCFWAKNPGDFELMEEKVLRITDPGRPRRSRTVKIEKTATRDGKSTGFQMGTKDDTPTRADIEAVLIHLPRLREQVVARTNDTDTAEGLYSNEFSSAVRDVVKAFFKHRFMFPFNYQPWMGEARKLQEDQELLAEVDLETIRKLVVVHWRQDYWDYDNTHWEFIAASGHLVALLERLQVIAEAMEPTNESPKNEFVSDVDDDEAIPIVQPESAEDAEFGNEWPTVGELMAGFDRIREKITPQQMVMLQAHYNSGGRAVTMRELGAASGYGDYKTANIQYGSLAKRLYQAIGYPAPRSTRSGKQYWVIGLGEFIDRSDYGLELHCVMRPEVATALEKLGIVEPTGESQDDEEPNAVYDRDVDDLAEILPLTSDSSVDRITDYIVYHNPDVMGPLADEPAFEVFTNKSVSGAKQGDRVWLITGDGTPRRFSLACWFYIAEFKSGGDLGFKHCVSGSEGESFSPFIDIAQDEWFTQLKHDQGNFAFGFSRITTPGAVENLEAIEDRALLGFLQQWMLEALERERDENLSEDDMARSLFNAISKTRAFLHKWDVFIDLDVESWTVEAERILGDENELRQLDLSTLRKLVSYINHVNERTECGGLDYWLELARSGQLPIILGRLREVFRREPRPEQPWYTDSAMRLEDISGVASWRRTILDIIKQDGERFQQNGSASDQEGLLTGTLLMMLEQFRVHNVFVKFDVDEWAAEAKRYVDISGELVEADLITLRKLLSYHRHNSRLSESYSDGYWERLAMNGHLVTILTSFSHMHSDLLSRIVADLPTVENAQIGEDGKFFWVE